MQRPSDLRFPLIVKPLDEDASVGIAQASVVRDDDALKERVTFIHERIKTDAIVEEFIAGRELYIGVMGNDQAAAAAADRDGVRQRRRPSRAASPRSRRSGAFATARAAASRTWSPRTCRRTCASGWPRSRCAPTRRRACTTTAASTCGWRTTTPSTSSRRIRIPTSPRAKISRGRRKRAGYAYPDFIEKIAEMAISRHASRG